jgi:hypothetical protein
MKSSKPTEVCKVPRAAALVQPAQRIKLAVLDSTKVHGSVPGAPCSTQVFAQVQVASVDSNTHSSLSRLSQELWLGDELQHVEAATARCIPQDLSRHCVLPLSADPLYLAGTARGSSAEQYVV